MSVTGVHFRAVAGSPRDRRGIVFAVGRADDHELAIRGHPDVAGHTHVIAGADARHRVDRDDHQAVRRGPHGGPSPAVAACPDARRGRPGRASHAASTPHRRCSDRLPGTWTVAGVQVLTVGRRPGGRSRRRAPRRTKPVARATTSSILLSVNDGISGARCHGRSAPDVQTTAPAGPRPTATTCSPEVATASMFVVPKRSENAGTADSTPVVRHRRPRGQASRARAWRSVGRSGRGPGSRSQRPRAPATPAAGLGLGSVPHADNTMQHTSATRLRTARPSGRPRPHGPRHAVSLLAGHHDRIVGRPALPFAEPF